MIIKDVWLNVAAFTLIQSLVSFDFLIFAGKKVNESPLLSVLGNSPRQPPRELKLQFTYEGWGGGGREERPFSGN